MSSPSEADLVAITQKLTAIDNLILLHGSTASTGLVALIDALEQAVESDFASEIIAGVAAKRAATGAAYANRQAWEGLVRTWGKFLELPAGASLEQIRDAKIQYMLANSKFYNSRGITGGAATAGGSNTGTGTAYLVTVGPDGKPIESVRVPDVITLRCVRDANLGAARGSEVFDLRSEYRSPDDMELLGGGLTGPALTSTHSDASIIANAGFDRFGGTAGSPTDITKWTSSITVNSTNYEFNTSPIFLPTRFSGEPRYSLRVKATATLTQRLDLTGAQVQQNVPYLCLLRWNRDAGSATGTLELHLGSKSNSVVLAAQTGWNTLTFLATLDHANAWYVNFAEDALDVKIVWTQTGGTGLDLDDLVCVPYIPVGAHFHRIASGATPWRAGAVASNTGDTVTYTDALAGSDGTIMRQWGHKFGWSFPTSTGGGVTWADP